MAPTLVGRALLGSGRLVEAAAELARAVESARAAGAAGTLALARTALDQALILTAQQPSTPLAEDPKEIEVEAIEAENDGLVALLEDRAEEAAAGFSLAVERWQQLGFTVWLGRALALQAATSRRAGDDRSAERLLARAGNVLDRIKTPARHRRGVLAPIP